MKVDLSLACTLVQYALFYVHVSLGKDVLFKKAVYGYNTAALQEFLLKTHEDTVITLCASICLRTSFCGSLVYIRSSQTCILWAISSINSIPVASITAPSHDAQVWIPGK